LRGNGSPCTGITTAVLINVAAAIKRKLYFWEKGRFLFPEITEEHLSIGSRHLMSIDRLPSQRVQLVAHTHRPGWMRAITRGDSIHCRDKGKTAATYCASIQGRTVRCIRHPQSKCTIDRAEAHAFKLLFGTNLSLTRSIHQFPD
jgi:hypothetical protein